MDIVLNETFLSNVSESSIWTLISRLTPGIEGEIRTRFLFRRQYLDDIKIGKKRSSIRYVKGKIDYPRLQTLPAICQAGTNDSVKCDITIEKIEIKTFREINIEDAEIDGFVSLEDLKDSLQEIYGALESDEYVTIYTFDGITSEDM